MPFTERPPGGDRTGTRHTAYAKQKIAEGVRRARRAEREANEEARNGLTAKKIRAKAEAAAFDQVFRDALEILREGEPEAAQRIVAIIRAGKDADALSAARELLDRTRGRPVQVQHSVSLAGQLSREEIAQLLAPAASLLGLEPPSTAADTRG